MKKKLLLASALLSTTLLFSCGGGGGSSDIETGELNSPSDTTSTRENSSNIGYATLKGTVQSGLSTQSITIGNTTIDKISAVYLDTNNGLVAVSGLIDQNGNFNLTLPKDKDYVLILFDTNGKPVVASIKTKIRVKGDANISISLKDTNGDGKVDTANVFMNQNNTDSNTSTPPVEIVPDNNVIDNNNNGIPDNVEIDKDKNGNPDWDNDGNGKPDFVEDKNKNGKPDFAEDHDGNGIPDAVEDKDKDGKLDGIDDENNNGKPDFMEDQNKNGKPDDVESSNGENESEENENNEHTLGIHYQGVSCAQCHDASKIGQNYNGEALEHAFKIGGTIFNDLQAPDKDTNKAAAYYWVKLSLENGNVFKSMVGRGTGNFWSNASIPDGVKFKVEVLDRNGNVVNSTNGHTHDNTRLDCNSCHTSSGTNGAPGRIVNYDYYGNSSNNNQSNTGNTTGNQNNTQIGNGQNGNDQANTSGSTQNNGTQYSNGNSQNTTNNNGTTQNNGAQSNTGNNQNAINNTQGTTGANNNTGNTTNQNNGNNTQSGGNNAVGSTQPNSQTVSFSKNVYPILKNNCQSCHGASSGSGNLRIGNDAITTYNNLMNTSPSIGGSFIDTANPSTSLLLQKATNSTTHGGGKIFAINSQEYQTILKWIQQGANNN